MTQNKPVIVLIPGGFCSPETYQAVADCLREDSFTVKVITLTTTRTLPSEDPDHDEYKDLASKGMLDDVKEIHDSIAKELDEGSKVVLFGHSYGSLPGLLSIEGYTLEERKAKGLAGGIKAYAAVAGFAFAVRERNIYGTTEQGPVMPNHSHEVSLNNMEIDTRLKAYVEYRRAALCISMIHSNHPSLAIYQSTNETKPGKRSLAARAARVSITWQTLSMRMSRFPRHMSSVGRTKFYLRCIKIILSRQEDLVKWKACLLAIFHF